MFYQSVLTKRRKQKGIRVSLSFFAAGVVFFYSSIGYAVTLTCNIIEVTLSDMRINGAYDIKDQIKTNFIYTNGEGDPIDVAAQALNTGFTPDPGYEALPDISWIALSPSSFTITGSGKQEVAVKINIPQNIQYLGKKYQGFIWGHTTSGQGRVGTITTLKIDVGSQYIGYGVTGYEALSSIGLIGDKAYITANVASLTAPTLKLYYRKTGDTAWTTVTTATIVAKADGTKDYTFEIPASAITIAGFQYIIESQAGAEYAYSPEQTRVEFIDTTKQKYHAVTVSRTTTGTIAATGSTLTVNDGNPNDGAVNIVAPNKAVAANLEIILEQIDETSPSCPAAPDFSLSEKPAMIFKLTPNGTRFLKNVEFSLLYFDTDNNGIVDGLLDRDGQATIEEAKLKMFWWDGFKWRLVNGTQTPDTAKNTIKVKINHFSYYALFPANALSPEDYRPAKKIITPNGDGINDEADFSGLPEEVKLFDITGRKIRTISSGTGEWDGKDDDGSVVESGVYIYQFKVDGTLVSGVIAVAK